MTQKEALKILKMGHNVFLTGSAGSGKTFVLNKYIEFLNQNKVGVGITASTGIAATHMNGMTIHSWLGIGIKDSLSKEDIEKILKKPQVLRRLKRTKVLIIDEVSMLHSFRLDLVDQVLKVYFENNLSFGGVQVVLCGDFFQLPPISRDSESADFVNKSKAWNEMDIKVCYLNEQHRQDNEGELLKILSDIRENNISDLTIKLLNKAKNKSHFFGMTTRLHTHNFNVDRLNNFELNKLNSSIKSYQMQFSGNKILIDFLKKSCLSPERLILRKGAIVMFTKNNFEAGYVNGTLGEVVAFNSSKLPVVKTFNKKEVVAEPEDWSVVDNGKTKAKIRQIPLRLAWAITIHKSQGMTLDAAQIDLSNSFVEGMGYVALSRVSSLSGLELLAFNDMALKVNNEVLSFDKELKESSEKAVSELNLLKEDDIQKIINKFVGKIEKSSDNSSTLQKTKDLVEKKFLISEIAEKREIKEGTVISYIEKMIERGEKLDLKYLKKSIDKKSFQKIKKAFKKLEDKKLAPVFSELKGEFSFEEIRLVRLFLD